MTHRWPLFAILLLGVAACDGERRAESAGDPDRASGAAPESPSPEADTATERGEARGAAPGGTAPSLERFAQDLLAAEESTLEGFRSAYGEPERVEREPTPNRHVPGQIDTVLTVHYDGARFRVHQVAGGRALIEHAEVTEPRFLRWPRPTIGTPADSVAAWWGEPLRREDGALVYEDPGPTSMPLTLHTRGGLIVRIERAFYVD